MENVFELRNISLGYNGSPNIKVDSFSFRRGGIYALLGPNGSGKTTLLRSLAGLKKPIAGKVLLDGNDLYAGKAFAAANLRRRVTLVMQTPILFDAGLLYNVAYGLKVRGIDAREASDRAFEAIALVGLKGLEHRNARQLSGGEAQRAAIARALATDADILLMDEPTGNVDVDNTRIIESIISQVSKEKGKTILFSTHSGRQARRLAEEAVHFTSETIKLECADEPAGYLWDL